MSRGGEVSGFPSSRSQQILPNGPSAARLVSPGKDYLVVWATMALIFLTDITLLEGFSNPLYYKAVARRQRRPAIG